MPRPPLRCADVLARAHGDLDRYHRDVVEGWRGLDPGRLKRRPAPTEWSAVDCLEHIRRANGLYMRQLARAVAAAEHRGSRAVETYRPGVVGARMRAAMAPREAAGDGEPRIAWKVRTFGGYDPAKEGPPREPVEVLARFSDQLEELRALVERLERIDLNTRTRTLLGPFLLLKAGDVVRYLAAHTDRHLVQAARAMA